MSQSVNTIRLLQQSLQLSICNGAFCIDATMGKGHDTLFLAELVGEKGRVLSMDVQPAALEATAALLQKHQMTKRVQLVLDGHEHMGAYAAPETVKELIL